MGAPTPQHVHRACADGYAAFDSAEAEAAADALLDCIMDYFVDGRAAFHPVDPLGSYRRQAQAARPYIARFAAERMPRYVRYFEQWLAHGGGAYVSGTHVCHVDIALFHAFRATEVQWGEAFRRMDDVPLFRAHGARMAQRPRIADYLASERCQPFSGDSMM